MAALSRIDTDLGPLQIYLMLDSIDSGRASGKRLTPETALLLATRFSQLSNWYLVFAEFPDLDDTSIKGFVKVADSIDNISNHSVRGNAMGMLQANLGIWQIFARQGEISNANLNQSLAAGDCALRFRRLSAPAIRRRPRLAENRDAGGKRQRRSVAGRTD